MVDNNLILQNLRNLFNLYPDIFPHVRNDYLQRCIDEHRVITHPIKHLFPFHGHNIDGVITWKKYKVRTKHATAGDFELCQMAVKHRGDGTATWLFKEFEWYANRAGAKAIVLSVRAANIRARRFYEKMGMVKVGEKAWANGTIPGAIYKKEVNSKLL